jgi:hypothetical protein
MSAGWTPSNLRLDEDVVAVESEAGDHQVQPDGRIAPGAICFEDKR